MTPTRDSFVWWLVIAGSLIGYLVSKQTPPTAWTYYDWLQFVAASVATISGKLATSPLPSQREVKNTRILKQQLEAQHGRRHSTRTGTSVESIRPGDDS